MSKKYKYRESFTYEGRRYQVWADTEKELAVKVFKKKQELESRTKKIQRNMLFSDWVDEWKETYLKNSVSAETYEGYESVIRVHVLPNLGHYQLKDIKVIHVQKMLNGLHGYSKKMISRVSELTWRILDDARKNGLILDNPAEDTTLPKGTENSRRAITDTERQYILQVAQYHRAGTWIYLMLYAGLRPAEACALQWRHVHFEERYIQVEQSVKRKGIIAHPKTKAGIRKVPLQNVLYDWLISRKGEPFEYVCPNTKGGYITASPMRKLWLSFERELNIAMGCKVVNKQVLPPYRVADDLVPYCLRHTFCTDLQDAGVPINVAKELMGHSDISITAKIYTHGTSRSFSQALDAMNKLTV